jgi:hypothetical protein
MSHVYRSREPRALPIVAALGFFAIAAYVLYVGGCAQRYPRVFDTSSFGPESRFLSGAPLSPGDLCGFARRSPGRFVDHEVGIEGKVGTYRRAHDREPPVLTLYDHDATVMATLDTIPALWGVTYDDVPAEGSRVVLTCIGGLRGEQPELRKCRRLW